MTGDPGPDLADRVAEAARLITVAARRYGWAAHDDWADTDTPDGTAWEVVLETEAAAAGCRLGTPYALVTVDAWTAGVTVRHRDAGTVWDHTGRITAGCLGDVAALLAVPRPWPPLAAPGALEAPTLGEPPADPAEAAWEAAARAAAGPCRFAPSTPTWCEAHAAGRGLRWGRGNPAAPCMAVVDLLDVAEAAVRADRADRTPRRT